jgi:hypothetical protein
MVDYIQLDLSKNIKNVTLNHVLFVVCIAFQLVSVMKFVVESLILAVCAVG